ncbi:hypothetical protein [Nonomuraea lactucae]|uniref:hypothetical protein n=1 Tax=Nonomuraea lactucae TaxID=2249762 RepID=UPI0013B3D9C2|nr:hypothetical protein [Nonomuraea lactucae]
MEAFLAPRRQAAAPVTIEWWGWAPGYDKVAEAWNAAQPNITVKFTQTESGAKGGYQKMLGAVMAGARELRLFASLGLRPNTTRRSPIPWP